ncbi:2'-5' RNA ligase family protein [Rhodococcus sp. BP-252]|uniref:2'-5' RNA ligase superfamily protein n=1 Tax=Rhodococcoides kyotonense TaxID=398843 RepID=A0A177YPT1_9NOCA|nr:MULTISPECIES: 2'-5' RNA ligase family protein [Rhodococcus]MBY6411265.1 2'-5' RNA ligase family protein [Rhodococcus sp. BP-320]MBY6415924.1 2'-5' RNA ligase family protein [Rhodococcus sp. BP-321]MBY6420567.1 2'-5' RNA ligase family protein [Rhodococcus sp. BP-324]MBY6426131.1 2'-5' RNA ligase family protein [Rhodococcus sp. BP-323]MBY6431328.1 2'-5' RNA ligase family protein [Rhodococcus sp. BP-322]
MVQSVELLLDDELDDAVRREWQLLFDAGLPSQARHRGASNRPHVTLAVADDFTDLDARIGTLPVPLFPIRLGPLVVFRGRHATLARLVIPSAELLDAHTAVASLVGTARGVRPHTAPGHWTPHVTLARRMTDDELGSAIELLHSEPGILVGETSALRRWDGDGKVEWLVGHAAQNP